MSGWQQHIVHSSERGRISAHNQTAGEAGVHTEQPAREAAECMLRFARSAASNR